MIRTSGVVYLGDGKRGTSGAPESEPRSVSWRWKDTWNLTGRVPAVVPLPLHVAGRHSGILALLGWHDNTRSSSGILPGFVATSSADPMHLVTSAPPPVPGSLASLLPALLEAITRCAALDRDYGLASSRPARRRDTAMVLRRRFVLPLP